MKNKIKITATLLSLAILAALITPLMLTTMAFAEGEVISVGSAEELIDFAKKCSYDAFSEGKTVVLSADISLEGMDFEPIASFSGVFDGQGHTISGLEVTDAYSPAGLFSRLEKDGVIKNLTLRGALSPDGDKGCIGGIVGDSSGSIENCHFIGTVIGRSDVGGIVGINRVSGRISGCTVGGEIIGETRTGGIAGSNEGLISSCENTARVNTISVTPGLSLNDINISLTLDISKLTSVNNSSMTDTGGIAGYSTGIIIGCVNGGEIGYPHIGYNVGGIAGRSSGHISTSTNNAEINGRKDVGGIAGQMEPHISYNLSEDLLLALKGELDSLKAAVNSAIGSADGGLPNISSRLATILESLDLATNTINTIINEGSSYGDQLIGEINRISEIVDQVILQVSGIADDLPSLAEDIGECLGKLESAVDNLKQLATVGADALSNISAAADAAADAFGDVSESIDSIGRGIHRLKTSLDLGDKAEFENAINTILDGAGAFVTATDEFTNATHRVTEKLGDIPWAKGTIDHLNALAVSFSDIAESVKAIYDATGEIKESVDIYWDKFKEGGDGLREAVGHLADMATSLINAAKLIEGGIEDVSLGLGMLCEAISTKDADAVKDAADKISSGAKSLINGGNNLKNAFTELEEAINGLDKDAEAGEIFSSLSAPLTKIGEAGKEAGEGISTIGSGIITVIDNITVEFDKIGEGGSLIIGGVGDISASMGLITDAAKALGEGIIALDKAIEAVSSAVVTRDEARLKSALDGMYLAFGNIIDSTSELADTLTLVGQDMKEAAVWGDGLMDEIASVTKALTNMSAALVKIQSGVDSLRGVVSFDINMAEEGLALICEGLWLMSDAAEDMRICFAEIADAFDKVEGGSEHLDAAVGNLRDFISGIRGVTGSIGNISEKLDLLVGYLDGVDPVQIPSPPESITAEANRLFLYISTIENELKLLNTDISGLGSELLGYLANINDIFGNISENIVSMIYSLKDGNIIDSTVSEAEIDSVTGGRLFSCVNRGDVTGDINVGGISGVMGLEYSLDPEDDLSVELTVTQKKQYRLKAIIHACHNDGSVTSKYDCAGGIVGKMDLGLIYGGEAYCTVESQSGNYVGGIAGISAGLISQSFAKCSLSGGKYVGGIVGSGVSEGYSGNSSMVRCCYSMVRIIRASQYSGAISGANAGEFSENLFVSDTLQGIDRVSYQGCAEFIAYEDLIKRKSIPDGFYYFTLEFVADGSLLHSIEFEYGSSFDSAIFPDIPKKDGHYGYWDVSELNHLVFDTTVSVIYKPYTTAIGSDEARGDREIFFVQGEFTETDRISVSEGCDTSTLLLTEGFFTMDRLIESWTLTIPRDNLDINNIHFLPDRDSCRVFVKIDGIWSEVEATEFGSYLSFDVSGEVIEIAIVEHTVKLAPVLALCGGGVIILASVIIVCVIVRRRAKVRAKKDDESSADEKSEA